ncbi:hypothetical protein HG531_000915 [Fusarium graminearum]|nr:hypothetical protein HG531_000915 [Fusarium graminearum]
MRSQHHSTVTIPIPRHIPPQVVLDYLQTYEPVLRHNPGMVSWTPSTLNYETVIHDTFFDASDPNQSLRCFEAYEIIRLGPGVGRDCRWPIIFQRVPNGIVSRADAPAKVISWTQCLSRRLFSRMMVNRRRSIVSVETPKQIVVAKKPLCNDISFIPHEHKIRNTLLGEAGNIGSHHRERYGKASCESHKDPETEQLASLVGSVTNKEGASRPECEKGKNGTHGHVKKINLEPTEAKPSHDKTAELCVSTIGNAKRKLEEHQEEDIGIRDDLSNLIPLEVVVLHSSLVASNSIDRIDALLFIEESCSGRSIWEKDD